MWRRITNRTMRSADLTKESCLLIWIKHKNDIEETIKNKSNDCKCKLKFENTSNCTWTNEIKLAYINKMIDKIKNCEEYAK